MSNNIEDLRSIYERGGAYLQKVADQAAESLKADSTDSAVVGSTAVDTGKSRPFLREGGFLDLLGKGVSGVNEQYKSGRHLTLREKEARKEGVAGLLEPINIPGLEMYMDTQRQNLANVVGLPVDLANSLLDLLGVNISNKPFFGSKHIKESLDSLKGRGRF